MTTFQIISLGVIFAAVFFWPNKAKTLKKDEARKLWEASVRRCIERWECPSCGDDGVTWNNKGGGRLYHCEMCPAQYYMDTSTVKKIR